MTTSRRSPRPRPSRRTRLRPQFDRLEERLALSASPAGLVPAVAPPPVAASLGAMGLASSLTVVAVDPAPGSALAAEPTAITVSFDRPIDGSVLFRDFRLDRVGSDGTLTPVAGDKAPIQFAEALDASGTAVVLSANGPLGPGRYRLSLLGNTPLSGLDGTSVIIRNGSDLPLGEFKIMAPGVRLGQATELGSPVSRVATVAGALATAADAALYRIELPQGHRWRLGVEVDAHRVGSPLDATLAVFDAAGRPIAVAQAGRSGSTNDPYLYVGLEPGVYYIGVSGKANVPGQAKGYDPVAGTRGSAGPGDVPGAFGLRVVADPADAATQLKTFAVDYADPTRAVPTGLTLQFAGPIDATAMVGHAAGLVTVVDASGRETVASAVGYDAARSTVTFVFAAPLPAGSYTVKLAGRGNLVDLAGRAPVAEGLPAGTLGTFVVGAAPAMSGPGDLGPLFLDAALAGVSGRVDLAAGATSSTRLVILVPGTYDLVTTYQGAAPSLGIAADGRFEPRPAGPEGAATHHSFTLAAGVIDLRIGGDSAAATGVGWTLILKGTSFDQLLNNGVGQSEALSLRLIAPASIASTSAPAGGGGGSGPSPSPTVSLPGGGPALPASTPGEGARGASASSSQGFGTGPAATASGGALYLAATAVGHPASQNDAISAVGPATGGGISALASSASGLPDGIAAGRGRRDQSRRSPGPGTPGEVAEGPTNPAADGPVVLAPADGAGALPPLPGAGADVAAADVAGPGPIERTTAALASWLRGASATAPAGGDDALLAAVDPSPGAADAGELEQRAETADLSGSVGVGVVAVALAHYHRKLAQWIERSRSRIVARRRGAQSPSDPDRPAA